MNFKIIIVILLAVILVLTGIQTVQIASAKDSGSTVSGASSSTPTTSSGGPAPSQEPTSYPSMVGGC